MRGGIFGVFNKNFNNSKKQKFIPLPYLKDVDLLTNCNDCSAPCINKCPQNIIIKRNDRVEINFMINHCVFCKECAIACEQNFQNLNSQISESKDKNFKTAPLDSQMPDKINARIKISELDCLAWAKVECQICLDNCKYDAINFSAKLYPNIDENKCTLCGACYSKCPKFCIQIF